MLTELIAIAIVSGLAGVVASIAGFGIGSLLTPLFALRMDLQLAVAAVSIPHLLSTVYRFVLIRKDLNKEVFVSFGIWSAVGGLSGGLMGIFIKEHQLIVLFATLLIFAGLSGVFGLSERFQFPRKFAWLAGLASGMFGGLAGNQGGIRSAALLSFNLSKMEFIATGTGIGLLVDAARMPVYFYQRFSDLLELQVPILIAVIGSLVGTWFGKLVLHKIPELIFKRIVCGIILVLGISMLLKKG
ncbi:MAG: sulfite exporter TauE/SafE family protein [Candidatus Melainabacteria bacterium]|jgi:uncharacterized membrane protein YfcA|nr:sulfite exporter TauE/SafE family protein [Candidatus Melainabacteria bacterium]